MFKYIISFALLFTNTLSCPFSVFNNTPDTMEMVNTSNRRYTIAPLRKQDEMRALSRGKDNPNGSWAIQAEGKNNEAVFKLKTDIKNPVFIVQYTNNTVNFSQPKPMSQDDFVKKYGHLVISDAPEAPPAPSPFTERPSATAGSGSDAGDSKRSADTGTQQTAGSTATYTVTTLDSTTCCERSTDSKRGN